MANKDNYGRLRVAAAIGVTSDAVERASALVNARWMQSLLIRAWSHKGVVTVLKRG